MWSTLSATESKSATDIFVKYALYVGVDMASKIGPSDTLEVIEYVYVDVVVADDITAWERVEVVVVTTVELGIAV